MKYLKFLIVGIIFGIILVKSEAVSWYRIYEMFMFESFHMYGIIGTALFFGIIFIQLIKRKKIKFYVVSHKTQFPYYGERINLHRISKNWLNNHIFNKKNRLGNCKYYFESTIKKKIQRIKKLKITLTFSTF